MRYFKNLRFIVGEKEEKLNLNREIDGTEHNYALRVYISKKGNFGLAVYLSMTALGATNILVYRGNYNTQREAEKDACRVLNELERANLSEYIEEWKSCSVTPVFDEKYKYVGDVYAPIAFLKENAKSFDYYNTNPLKNFYGTFYVLDNKNCYREETVGLSASTSKVNNNPKVISKLVSQLNKKRHARFFE